VVIATEALGKSTDFDVRLDPAVRIIAGRVRRRLKQYYDTEGLSDPVIIEFPPSGYVPTFKQRKSQVPQGKTPTRVKTLVVLPFSKVNSESGINDLRDGLTIELIHSLTRLRGLRVIAWDSVAQLRGDNRSPQHVREDLGADVMVDGSVLCDVDRLRIIVQLVDTYSGEYLWSECYDGTLREIPAIQERLARSISSALKLHLVEEPPTSGTRASSPEAHSFYLRGREAWARRTHEGLLQSLALYERALEKDQNCALAWAGLADSCGTLADYGLRKPDEMIARARHSAERALALDATLAEAHTSLGFIRGVYDWQWTESMRHYQRAIDLNPGYATAYHWYGTDCLALLGQFDHAIEVVETALDLNPNQPIVKEALGYVHMLARHFDTADMIFRQLQEDFPEFAKGYTALGRVLAARGRYDEAISMLEKGRVIGGELPSTLSALGQVHAMRGDLDMGRHFLRMVQNLAKERYVPSTCLVLVYLGLSEIDTALDWLEAGCEHHDLPLTTIAVHPAYDGLRGEPRFQDVLQKMNLSDAGRQPAIGMGSFLQIPANPDPRIR
jgi:serine/threonine-protein kinase